MPKFLRPFESYANYYEPVLVTATLSASAALTIRQDAWAIIAWSPEDAPGLRSVPDAGLTPYLYESEDQAKLAVARLPAPYSPQILRWFLAWKGAKL